MYWALKSSLQWIFFKEQSVLRLSERLPLIFSPSFYRKLGETFLFSLSSLISLSGFISFLCHLLVLLGGCFLCWWWCLLWKFMLFSVFFFLYVYLSTPFSIMLCQKMVFTPSKALSLRPVRRTAREQSPAKPTAGCDPKYFQTCPIIICKECHNDKWHTTQFILCTYFMFSKHPKKSAVIAGVSES